MELELNKDFREFLKLLDSKNVKYLLIGGYAVIAYGHPRLTLDLDVAIANDARNIELVVEALAEFGFAGDEKLSPLLFAEPKSVVRAGYPPVKVEIVNYLKGVEFAEAYDRRVRRSAEDLEFNLISLTDLLANKTAVGRDKDLLDVKELLKVNKKK